MPLPDQPAKLPASKSRTLISRSYDFFPANESFDYRVCVLVNPTYDNTYWSWHVSAGYPIFSDEIPGVGWND